MIQIPFKKLDKNAVIPEFKHLDDAGKDLIAVSYNYNEKYDRHEYGLGFATAIPEGYYIKIAPRSSNTKTNLYLPNGEGTIDAGYRGEWKVFYKSRDKGGDKEYNVGDAIAQCFLCKRPDWEFVEVDELDNTDRGADGGINRDDINFKV